MPNATRTKRAHTARDERDAAELKSTIVASRIGCRAMWRCADQPSTTPVVLYLRRYETRRLEPRTCEGLGEEILSLERLPGSNHSALF